MFGDYHTALPKANNQFIKTKWKVKWEQGVKRAILLIGRDQEPIRFVFILQ